jgi:hypothetical protein
MRGRATIGFRRFYISPKESHAGKKGPRLAMPPGVNDFGNEGWLPLRISTPPRTGFLRGIRLQHETLARSRRATPSGAARSPFPPFGRELPRQRPGQCQLWPHFCGLKSDISRGPGYAAQKIPLYSITSSTCASKIGESDSPSACAVLLLTVT